MRRTELLLSSAKDTERQRHPQLATGNSRTQLQVVQNWCATSVSWCHGLPMRLLDVCVLGTAFSCWHGAWD